ncbi:hypothetical protein F4561_000423 [Lipingzhangella halophila]|uniref:Uncharacterized protein n=1 Tax=Lipingzhangella halophila TaxID=1783352 RepID=A0A7W7RDG1_9ACTN|nr:hypothetical protein [Lipingzhangella halophila]MBB4929603.1 hypothetical protein [Lipingzhangella halophila]
MRGPLLAAPALFLVLGLAACGGSGDSGGGGGDPVAAAEGGGAEEGPAAMDEEQRLEFSECMRDNGVDMPDSQSNSGGGAPGGVPEGPNTEAAIEECEEHLPNGGEPPEVSEEDLENLQAFTECMRDNDIDMPDPGADGTLNLPEDVDPSSSEFQDAGEQCRDETGGAPVHVQKGNP